jgi:hypothetical protein
LQTVADAELVVADLSTHNPNVFYELAIRHASQKPIVQLISVDEELPFDIAAMRTIFFDIGDLDSAESARTELGEHIAALEADPTPVDTPIAAALGIQALRESEDPMAQTVAELADQVAALRSEMARERRRPTIASEPLTMQTGTIRLGQTGTGTGTGSLLSFNDPSYTLTDPPFKFVASDALVAQPPKSASGEPVRSSKPEGRKRTPRRAAAAKKRTAKK